MEKKKVIAYLHTHWDREWYKEFEVFRIRLIHVFDNVLNLLENNKIPSFYFDGHVNALLEYLKIRPEKEALIRKLVGEKRLFIGPFYVLVDEFLIDRNTFRKNLEIGLKIAKDFGCTDFIGYFADTFGHSKNAPLVLKEFGIDKCIVWRGCGTQIPADFKFMGIDTINLIRGYYMDIFSSPLAINQKADWLKEHLDKIAEKSRQYLLLPIGADHLGIEPDIVEQISKVNELLEDYEIKLSNPFEYFELAKNNFNQFNWDDELRDNSLTFTLQGSFSSRMDLKQYNVKTSYLLEMDDKLQQKYGCKYAPIIEHAYKLLLSCLAHDGIYGCSSDLVCREIIIRYEKVIQIATTIVEELKVKYGFKTPIMYSDKPIENYKIIGKYFGVENALWHDTQKAPVTEDFKDIYTLKYSPNVQTNLKLEFENEKLFICDGKNRAEIEFIRYEDTGDTYNFGAVEDDKGEKAQIYSYDGNIIKTSFFDIEIEINKLINFKIEWDNKLKNKLWQVKFNLDNPVNKTYSEDMNTIIEREFDPNYEMREHLPQKRGIEVKTNFAPMQRYVGAQGFGIITQGLNEYEVKNNSLLITLLRSTGVISNPKNPSRSTPAGPPIEVPDAQMLGKNLAEFSVGFFEAEDYQEYIDIVFPTNIEF